MEVAIQKQERVAFFFWPAASVDNLIRLATGPARAGKFAILKKKLDSNLDIGIIDGLCLQFKVKRKQKGEDNFSFSDWIKHLTIEQSLLALYVQHQQTQFYQRFLE